MADAQYEIRTMNRDDLERAIGWAADEGWNPGLSDLDAFLAADPEGFLMGWLGDQPISSIAAVQYGRRYGFIGFYIVIPEFRGRSFGLPIWNAGVQRIEGRLSGLDGVPDQQSNYRKSGYELAHRNVRYGGELDIDGPSGNGTLIHVGADRIDAVVAYDRAFFPDDRSVFIRKWLEPDQRTARALIEDGAVSGYGVIRPCREGSKIGPLFADTEAGAVRLFEALVAEAGDGPVFLDPPETNPAAVALAKRYGLEPAFETARMYNGPEPDISIDRTFGITTFELG